MAIWKLMGAAAAMALLAMPARAQDGISDEKETELYCVYDVLSQSGDLYDIADVFVDEDAKDEDVKAADALLNDAVDQCLDEYEWSDKIQEFAATIGIHGSVVDVLTSDLSDEGLKEEQISAIFDVLDGLSDEDVDVFSDPSWLGNTAFQRRIKTTLVANGVPDKAEILKSSMLVIESSVLAAQAIVDWMDEIGDDGAAHAKPASGSASSSGSKKSNKSSHGSVAGGGTLTATGTGFYIAQDGYLVTNAHVVDGCKRMTLKNGDQLQIIDVRKDEDLALLKGAAAPRPLAIRDGRSARLAEDVLVAGFPLGGILSSGINVTVGTVSALAGLGDDEARFQFTAPVQPGNSGGPVLDGSGNVIGVVVSKLDAMSVQKEVGDIPQNVNFGISLPHLVNFLKSNHVPYEHHVSGDRMDKVDLAELARASTVLLQCYE